jgi:hypothetical protein
MADTDNPTPDPPPNLGEAGMREWNDAVLYGEQRPKGSHPWSAIRGAVIAACEAADVAARATEVWIEAGRPTVTTHVNGSTGPAPEFRTMLDANAAYSRAHVVWAGRHEGKPTTNAAGGQKGTFRAPDRVGRSSGAVRATGNDIEAAAERARTALRVLREGEAS